MNRTRHLRGTIFANDVVSDVNREAEMLSRPSPEEIVVTEKQADTARRVNRMVRSRRSARTKGY